MGVVAESLQLPIAEYAVTGYKFGQRVRSRVVLYARHLGDDILAVPETKVFCIGDGMVVWSEMRLGSDQKRNWGGIVVVEHVHKQTGTLFYSVYGHLYHLTVHVGEVIHAGDRVGVVAPGPIPENGFWKLPHLHFGIYTGPWTGKVLPGYARPFEQRTKFAWWVDPKPFVETYNKLAV